MTDSLRVQRTKAALAEAKIDALILRLPENIVMSCGCWPMNGFSYAVITAEHGPAVLIAPSCEDEEMSRCWAEDIRFFTWPRLDMPDPMASVQLHLADVAGKLGIARGRIGYEGGFDAIAPAHNAGELLVPVEATRCFFEQALPDATFTDATSLLYELRATKTPDEIERLRIAHKVAGFGIEAFHDSVAPGVTEAALASTIYTACLTRGVALADVQFVNVFPQISSGGNAHRAWRPIVTTGNRELKAGEIAVLEMAVCVDGYWADVTRVKVAGQKSDIQQKAFGTVLAAQAAAVEMIKAGVVASDVHQCATQILIEGGFEKQIVHLTGHGVGFRYHEPEPLLMPGNDQKLRVGHTCTVEPGLYEAAWGGIRLEDNVVVQAEGADVLTTSPKML